MVGKCFIVLQISPYNYDKIQAVLDQVVAIESHASAKYEQKIQLLEYLKLHTRTGKVQDKEKEWIAKWKQQKEVIMSIKL